MSTSKQFIEYFLDRMTDIGDITLKSMMGEYLIYYRGKLVGDICNNRVLIKPVSSAQNLMPSADMQPPYQGAKAMLVLDNFEDTDFVKNLFEAMYAELPEPKAKKGRTVQG